MLTMLEKETLQIDISLLKDTHRVLLAVSGGADSVAMAHALVNLKKESHLPCAFVIGHVNHQLRGGHSDTDECFVQSLALLLGIPVVTKSVDVKGYAKEHKLSIETAGRQLRMQILAGMAENNECDCVATAHHKDDQAETLIHRLMRGTGYRGLCGIRPVSQVYGSTFIRPMLKVRRSEIMEYCRKNGLDWREDATNRNVNFTRNRIRHQLLPSLNSDTIVERLSVLSKKSRELLHKTEAQAESILSQGHFDKLKKEFAIKQDVLQECSPLVFYECVRQGLLIPGAGLRHYTQAHFESICEMARQSQAKADFPDAIEVNVRNGSLVIRKKTGFAASPQEPVTLDVGRTVRYGPWKISSRLLDRTDTNFNQFLREKDRFVEWFDQDTICGPIIIRPRQDGDRFHPVGSKGEKKVARFLQDGQLDQSIRQEAFMIADSQKILWVAPLRMAEQAKISPMTRQILEIHVQEK